MQQHHLYAKLLVLHKWKTLVVERCCRAHIKTGVEHPTLAESVASKDCVEVDQDSMKALVDLLVHHARGCDHDDHARDRAGGSSTGHPRRLDISRPGGNHVVCPRLARVGLPSARPLFYRTPVALDGVALRRDRSLRPRGLLASCPVAFPLSPSCPFPGDHGTFVRASCQ